MALCGAWSSVDLAHLLVLWVTVSNHSVVVDCGREETFCFSELEFCQVRGCLSLHSIPVCGHQVRVMQPSQLIWCTT